MRTRRTKTLVRLLAAAAAAATIAACGPPIWSRSDSARSNGPDYSNLTLNHMIDKYGPPQRIELNRAVWTNKGPWKRISVWDDMELQDFTLAKDNNLEVTLAYPVPADRRGDVTDFGGRISVSSDGSEISASSYSEERIFLVMNLADEVIRGAKTPQQARDFDALTLQLADAGKSSPYMQRLLFQPPVPAAP
jgi:hypothetical protein